MHVPTLLFSLAVLATLLAFARLMPRAPGPLIAVLLALRRWPCSASIGTASR